MFSEPFDFFFDERKMTSKYRSMLEEQKFDLSFRELERCDYFHSTRGSTVYGDLTQNAEGSEKGLALHMRLQRLIANEQIHSFRWRYRACTEEGRARSVIESDYLWGREQIVADLKASWFGDMFFALMGISYAESEGRKGALAEWERSLPVM